MKLAYLGVLAFILLATAWLEIVLRTRVYRRWKRLALTLIVPVAVFLAWDIYAISQGHWDFDPQSTTGIVLPGSVPVEELLFFIVIPIASILSLEAVRSVKGWPVGDESNTRGDSVFGDDASRWSQ